MEEIIAEQNKTIDKHQNVLADIDTDIQKAKTKNAKQKDQLASYEEQYQRDRIVIKNSNHEKEYLLKQIDRRWSLINLHLLSSQTGSLVEKIINIHWYFSITMYSSQRMDILS